MADPVEFEMMHWSQSLPGDRRSEAQMLYMRQRKDRGTALILSLLVFFGFPGIGRLYLGDVAQGILMLLFGWFTCGIWPLIDLFLISGATDQHNRNVLMRIRSTMSG